MGSVFLPRPVRLLRDKATLTRLLLLLELQRTTHTTLRTLAERVGITVQGVSNYVAEFEKEGLARVGQGRYEVTPRGTQWLQEHLGELKGFVDVAYQRLSVVEECSALAATAVREGEVVGLFLEQGLLLARARQASPSQGAAAHPARAGDLVRVRGLTGLVALRPGRLTVLKVPPFQGPATRTWAASLRRWMAEQGTPGHLSAVGTEAQVLARAARLDALAFAPVHAAHHAAQLGLDAVVLAGEDQLRFVLAELERLDEEAFEPVRHRVRDLRGSR